MFHEIVHAAPMHRAALALVTLALACTPDKGDGSTATSATSGTSATSSTTATPTTDEPRYPVCDPVRATCATGSPM